ncbi:N-glycosylase/DNA lyase [Hippea maritima]|uniref:8-oxoguanine DNA glycosylase/AP lyase n=1 Tax=Hippea maritima (strain ATCC 700847 / DSM 10411 / MH2) TaxID=760142 RepID=F2LTY7_HIPMA|nr:N-glycosylase/DNA lyase [Hippea maritima]AEA33386.1 DNA-(apurinic or apyrimidinic site) lyase [Hippea maritima DSM 10411]
MLKTIFEVHEKLKPQIEKKLLEFKMVWMDSDERILEELLFCLLTPQSKAEKAWQIIEDLEAEGKLLDCDEDELAERFRGVRFRVNKARYVKEALEKFVEKGKITLKSKLSKFSSQKEARKWLVDNVKGMGYKESSHFLRNIGKGEELSILDRHILRALLSVGLIDAIPKTITPDRYLVLEEKMRELSNRINIPLAHLDFVLWQIQTNRIFK